MLRTLEIKDFETLNNLINDPNYIIDEAELKKISKVYLKDDKIIGYISYQIMYERAELNYIFVKEEERKKGIASKMLEYMLNNLKEEGNSKYSFNANINSCFIWRSSSRNC